MKGDKLLVPSKTAPSTHITRSNSKAVKYTAVSPPNDVNSAGSRGTSASSEHNDNNRDSIISIAADSLGRSALITNRQPSDLTTLLRRQQSGLFDRYGSHDDVHSIASIPTIKHRFYENEGVKHCTGDVRATVDNGVTNQNQLGFGNNHTRKARQSSSISKIYSNLSLVTKSMENLTSVSNVHSFSVMKSASAASESQLTSKTSYAEVRSGSSPGAIFQNDDMVSWSEDVLPTLKAEQKRRASQVEHNLKNFEKIGISLNNKEEELIHAWENFFAKIDQLKMKDHITDSQRTIVADFKMIGKFGSALKSKHYKIYKRYQKLVNAGIPMQFRANVWSLASGSRDSHTPGEYELLLNDAKFYKRLQSQSLKSKNHDNYDTIRTLLLTSEKQIELDCVRTMRSNKLFQNEQGPGMRKLRSVLIAFARKYPHVGYCQGMNIIVGNLLLVYRSEHETFDCFKNLVTGILHKEFFKPPFTRVKVNVDILTNHFFKANLPQLYDHLFNRLNVDFNFFLFNWLLTLFIDILPTDVLFKFWDSLLCLHGEIELFRITLAIFKFFEKSLTFEFNTSDEVYDFLINLKSKIISYNLTGDVLVGLLASFATTVTEEKLKQYRDMYSL